MPRQHTPEQRELLFWTQVQKTPNGCWLWTGSQTSRAAGGTKYGAFYHPGGTLAHRYSFLRNCGEIPPGRNVCHHCDTPLCVRPDHLYLADQKQNMQDASLRKRLDHRGERNGNAKLTAAQVAEIRAVPKYFGVNADLGRKYGVTLQLISQVRRGMRW